MLVSWITLLVTAVMDDERTASSSRRSAKLRERSSGRESRECVYSVRSAREWAVLAGEVVTVVDEAGGLGGPMEDMMAGWRRYVCRGRRRGTKQRTTEAPEDHLPRTWPVRQFTVTILIPVYCRRQIRWQTPKILDCFFRELRVLAANFKSPSPQGQSLCDAGHGRVNQVCMRLFVTSTTLVFIVACIILAWWAQQRCIRKWP